jgi:HAD superfamily hydrolase (TIGR01509 family)
MIKNIIFDIGNVLITFNPEEYLRVKVADEESRRKIHQAVFLSPEWLLLDRGILSEEEAIRIYHQRCPEVMAVLNSRLSDLYEGLLNPIDETIAVMYDLKNRGYRIYILSNYQEKAFAFIKERYGFPDHVDGKVLSYEVRHLKPEPEIYHALLDKYGLMPEETVFIDDSLANIKAAEFLGIKGIHYTDHESFKRDLNKALLDSKKTNSRCAE